MDASRPIVVTGATGFLGGAVARRLHALGVPVRALGRDAARLDALRGDGLQAHAVDLSDASAVAEVIAGAHAVVHSAALSSPWGPRTAFWRANVDATAHVAQACVAHGVSRLVHVSTPGIHHDGRPHLHIREGDPLPARAVNAYAASKRAAEDTVRRLAVAGALPTIILRPRAIFGPGDRALLPRLADALARGRLPRIGDGACRIDMTYIDNAVDAVLHALQAPATPAARAYGISNGEPVRVWDVIDGMADALALPRPHRHVPARVAWWAAAAAEMLARAVHPGREPPLTRYGVELLTVDMTLDITRARQELGYAPEVGMAEALARTYAALSPAAGRAA